MDEPLITNLNLLRAYALTAMLYLQKQEPNKCAFVLGKIVKLIDSILDEEDEEYGQ